MNINNDPKVNRIKSFTTIDAVGIIAGVVLMIIAALIVFPTKTGLDLNLQMFVVMLVMLVLAGRNGTFVMGIYVLIGALGFPVFIGGYGGTGTLFGERGGFIIGTILLALMMWRITTFLPEKIWVKIFAIVMGLVMYYLCGSIWYSGYSGLGVAPGFIESALPYIPFDLIMAAAAFGISIPLNKIIRIDRHRLT